MPDTSRPADARSGTSILVTGAAGNLGREIVHRLQARGARVRLLVRRPAEPRPGIESVAGDLTDPAVVRAALVGVGAVFLIWPLLDAAPAHDLVAELVERLPASCTCPLRPSMTTTPTRATPSFSYMRT